MRRTLFWTAQLVGVAWALAACATPPAATNLDATVTPDVPLGEIVTHTVEIARRGVALGSEATVCINVPAGIDEDSLLVAVRTHLSAGSHHLIVSRADDVTPSGTPFLCDPFRHGLDDTVFIAQQPEAEIVYPAGSGLPMPAGQAVGLELHVVNYLSDTPIDIVGTVELDLVALPASYREVHIAFAGSFSLLLPPHAETTERYSYSPGNGSELLAVTSHTHQLGTFSSIDLVTPAGRRRLHESRSWADPPLDVFSPPIPIGPLDRLALECTYLNTTDRTVTFGKDFEDEMCFLWAYYLEPL